MPHLAAAMEGTMHTSSTRRLRRTPRRAVMLSLALLTASLGAGITPSPASADARPVTAADTACPHMTDSIIRLYSAYFLRAPDAAGFNFWAGEFSSGARGLQGMSDFFATSDEFNSLYANLSNPQFVDLVYRNVLGRQAEASGRNFWIGQLDSGAITRGTLMINFSESEEYVARTGTAVPLAGYFNWYPDGTAFTCGSEAVNFGLLPEDDNVDILVIHDPRVSAQGGFFDIYDVVGGTPQYFTGGFVPFDHIDSGTFDASLFSAEGIQILSEPQVSTYIVAYPNTQPALDTRSGWRTDQRRQPTFTELLNELADAEFATDVYWRNQFPDLFALPYSPPSSRGFYDGTRPSLAPTCSGITLSAYNAFYCRTEDYVAYDINLVSEAYRFNGDGFVYFLVAHEWAHAIQERMPQRFVSGAHELQADCLAGAALFGNTANAVTVDGNGTITFEPGDFDELFATFEQIGSLPWISGGSHGSAEERRSAFALGANEGVPSCLAASL